MRADRNRELEMMIEHGQTRVDPVEDPDALTHGMDASNDTIQTQFGLEDQVGSREFQSVHLNAPRPMNGSDNLQRIKGIGPAIEKTLHELGIFSFQQIAELTEYDIDRVANRLRGFRSRIYREDWIGQARELQYQSADT